MIMRPAGQPKESYGDRSFQGIGKTTREAKQAAAKAALTKLRATMPGIKFAPGVIPFAWSDWCRKNLKRGALLEDLLKTLTTKGFHPAKNPGFMEKFLLIRSWAYAFGEPFPPQEKVKRPKTGYQLYAESRREKVVAENPGAGFAEISKILGEKWKSIPDERKKKYGRTGGEN